MSILPKSITNLIDELSRLPGVGPKTAARLAFYLLSKSGDDNKRLGNAICELKESLKQCQNCYNYAESDPCGICADENRDDSIVTAVEEPLDVVAIEKTGYNGIYHVLGGAISPINGIGPEDIRIRQLVDKISKSSKLKELIIATNPTLEGEATAMYIKQQLVGETIAITRLARGLPVGGDLEYADEATLSRAIEGRKSY